MGKRIGMAFFCLHSPAKQIYLANDPHWLSIITCSVNTCDVMKQDIMILLTSSSAPFCYATPAVATLDRDFFGKTSFANRDFAGQRARSTSCLATRLRPSPTIAFISLVSLATMSGF
jgi:hypothetical protein